jgi:hypothetical protein
LFKLWLIVRQIERNLEDPKGDRPDDMAACGLPLPLLATKQWHTASSALRSMNDPGQSVEPLRIERSRAERQQEVVGDRRGQFGPGQDADGARVDSIRDEFGLPVRCNWTAEYRGRTSSGESTT